MSDELIQLIWERVRGLPDAERKAVLIEVASGLQEIGRHIIVPDEELQKELGSR